MRQDRTESEGYRKHCPEREERACTCEAAAALYLTAQALQTRSTSPEPSSSINEKSSLSSFLLAGDISIGSPVIFACVLDAKNLSDESLRNRSRALRACAKYTRQHEPQSSSLRCCHCSEGALVFCPEHATRECVHSQVRPLAPRPASSRCTTRSKYARCR